MDTVSLFGWVAAGFVLSSFSLRTMVPLRLVAVASNVMFIAYAVLASAMPILVLHCLLFPLNVWRLLEMRNLRRKFLDATPSQALTVLMQPFMQQVTSGRGHVLFNKGDVADSVYFILRGAVQLQDGKKSITDGQLLGLIGVCSKERRRADSALCLTDVQYGVIAAEKFWELVCQDPTIANHVIRSIVDREHPSNQKQIRIGNMQLEAPYGAA